jgi:hypothetical protein
MNGVQRTALQPHVNCPATDTQGKKLPPRNNPVLPRSQLGQHAVNALIGSPVAAFATHVVANAAFVGHGGQDAGRPRASAPQR